MDFADHIVRLSKNKPQQHCKPNPQSTSPPLFNNIVFKTQLKKPQQLNCFNSKRFCISKTTPSCNDLKSIINCNKGRLVQNKMVTCQIYSNKVSRNHSSNKNVDR